MKNAQPLCSVTGLILGLCACGSLPSHTAPSDLLAGVEIGSRPTLSVADLFVPPAPTVLRPPGLPEVWFLERRSLPLIGLRVVVSRGSAHDPPGKAGLAALTAEMMEQGAGRFSALEIAREFDRIGATASVSSERDATVISVSVLRPHLSRALELLSDVLARPRFEEKDFERAKHLWLEQLAARAFDPSSVGTLVANRALLGDGHPYGRPVDGLVADVNGLKLADVRSFHAQAIRPKHARILIVGDVRESDLQALLTPVFSPWGALAEADGADLGHADGADLGHADAHRTWADRPRAVIVDRPDAPQTLLILAAPGPSAGSSDRMALTHVNTPLGALFTSRLNANLREDKGYTYGARSIVSGGRFPGLNVAMASVERSVTEAALRELVKEVDGMARGGPTDEELKKARAAFTQDAIESYETLDGALDSLTRVAVRGLPPDADARAARAALTLTDEQVRAAAPSLGFQRGALIAVGDRKTIEHALTALDWPTPEVRDEEGRP